MNKTKIEWVKNPDGSQGWTLNPFTGCHNHDNGLCKGGGFPCYAYRLAHGRLKQRYLEHGNLAIPDGETHKHLYLKNEHYRDPFYPRFWEERLYHPWGGEPKGIFVCDMSDLFGIGIPGEWTETVLNLIRKHDENRYYLLTKQPANLLRWSPFPDNCYVGVTATDYWKYVDACNYLSRIEASVKFLSLEPLLSWDKEPAYFFQSGGVSWLIIGGQTKPDKPPKIEWLQEIVQAADKAGIPVFLKDNLKPLLCGDALAGQASLDMGLLNWAGELRQEMPRPDR